MVYERMRTAVSGRAVGDHAQPNGLRRGRDAWRTPSTATPLSGALRSYFEPRFGHDFSQVRIHSDSDAAASARSFKAQAYTQGNDIVFADGAFRPETRQGKRLIAHELAHVVQQDSTAFARGTVGLAEGVASHDATDADLAADRAADRAEDWWPGASPDPQGRLATVPRSIPAVQRKPAAPPPPMEHLAGTLYARAPDGTPLPPSLDDIAQGGLSDCFLMAALAAIVSADPRRIRNMIAFGPNGAYTVTFKGIGFLSSARQTVTADFVKSRHAHLGPRQALWPLVIERAYAQEKGGIDVIDKGGNPGTVVDDMLNDGPSRFDPREKSSDYILGKVAKGKAKKWPMTILSPKAADAGKEKQAMTTRITGLHFWHSYAIVDVDAKSGRIKLFNPWGQSHPNGSGWIDVADVRKFFIEIGIND